MKSTLDSTEIMIKPSHKLLKYIINLEQVDDMPTAINSIRSKDIKNITKLENNYSSFISDKDHDFISTLKLNPVSLNSYDNEITEGEESAVLSLKDLTWVWHKMQEDSDNLDNSEKPFLHTLLEESEIFLPINLTIPRNKELDKRCDLLKIQQQNREYKAITKNVDNTRMLLPEDTISYQLKEINKQLIAIIQFLFSIFTGFLFGFLGIEILIGSSFDFGFRLLLGVICSLTVALAELYFLAKKLNEDLHFEKKVEKSHHLKTE